MRAAGGMAVAAAYEVATLRMAARVAAEEVATLASRLTDLGDEVEEQREAFRGIAGRLQTLAVDLGNVEFVLAAQSPAAASIRRALDTVAQLRQVCVLRGEQ